MINYYFNRIRDSIPKKAQYIYWIEGDYFRNPEFRNLDVFKLNNTIFHYWGGYDTLIKSTLENKPNLILSPVDYTYLDCGGGSRYGDDAPCNPYITWKKIYRFDPDLAKDKFNVLGSITCLWSEVVDDSNVIQKIYPRATSLSEKLWYDFENKRIDVKDAFKRLNKMIKRLKERKVFSSPISNLICEDYPEDCINFVS